jgi:hypothetical protein
MGVIRTSKVKSSHGIKDEDEYDTTSRLMEIITMKDGFNG